MIVSPFLSHITEEGNLVFTLKKNSDYDNTITAIRRIKNENTSKVID
jgi:hypothetical protein